MLALKQTRKETEGDKSHIYEEFKYKTNKVLLSRRVFDAEKTEFLDRSSSRDINLMPLRLVSTRWRIISVPPPEHLEFHKDTRPTLRSFLD